MAKILVVDDLPFNVEFLQERLEDLGHEVGAASDGEEALEQIYSAAPDLVLLDLSMPKLDGIQVLETLRADPRYQGLPVVLLTARKEFDHRIKGLNAGADDYITKPFHPEEVVARINALLRIQELQQQVLDREKMLSRVEGIGQMLVTLSHHINNATQAILGMAQLCESRPDDFDQHRMLAQIAFKQSTKISAVLQSLQQMVDQMDLQTADYAGDPDRMLDIEADLERRLQQLDEPPEASS